MIDNTDRLNQSKASSIAVNNAVGESSEESNKSTLNLKALLGNMNKANTEPQSPSTSAGFLNTPAKGEDVVGVSEAKSPTSKSPSVLPTGESSKESDFEAEPSSDDHGDDAESDAQVWGEPTESDTEQVSDDKNLVNEKESSSNAHEATGAAVVGDEDKSNENLSDDGQAKLSSRPKVSENGILISGERPPQYDPYVAPDFIRVLSRTLYVGALPDFMREETLRELFEKYGDIETLTVNVGKRNAFLKMTTRSSAEAVKENCHRASISSPNGMSTLIRINWACGYGPKEYFDFMTGVSTVPLNRLSKPEQTWMKTSYRGGGPVVGGTTVEEPETEGFSKKVLAKAGAIGYHKEPPSSNSRAGGPVPSNFDLYRHANQGHQPYNRQYRQGGQRPHYGSHPGGGSRQMYQQRQPRFGASGPGGGPRNQGGNPASGYGQRQPYENADDGYQRRNYYQQGGNRPSQSQYGPQSQYNGAPMPHMGMNNAGNMPFGGSHGNMGANGMYGMPHPNTNLNAVAAALASSLPQQGGGNMGNLGPNGPGGEQMAALVSLLTSATANQQQQMYGGPPQSAPHMGNQMGRPQNMGPPQQPPVSVTDTTANLLSLMSGSNSNYMNYGMPSGAGQKQHQGGHHGHNQGQSQGRQKKPDGGSNSGNNFFTSLYNR